MQFPFSKFSRVILGTVGMFLLYFLVDYYHLLSFSGSGANPNRLLHEVYPDMPKVGISFSSYPLQAPSQYDFSIITQSGYLILYPFHRSFERVFFLPYLARRWKG